MKAETEHPHLMLLSNFYNLNCCLPSCLLAVAFLLSELQRTNNHERQQLTHFRLHIGI